MPVEYDDSTISATARRAAYAPVPAFEIETLNPWTAPGYSALATRVFANLLGLLGPGGRTLGVGALGAGAVGVGATIGGLPVGVALAEPAEDCFVLRWIFVAPACRRLGIAGAMLKSLEAEMRQRGAIGIRSAYPVSLPDAPGIGRLFERAGWPASAPAIRMICTGSLLSERWVRGTRVPRGFCVFQWVGSWAESSDWNHSWVPQHLAPHRYRQRLEPLTSLGLSWNGVTLGWLLTSKLGPELICYESVFVRSDARRLGGARLLLAEGIRRQAAAFGSGSQGVFTVAAGNQAMMHVVARHLRPHQISETEIMALSKPLAQREAKIAA